MREAHGGVVILTGSAIQILTGEQTTTIPIYVIVVDTEDVPSATLIGKEFNNKQGFRKLYRVG